MADETPADSESLLGTQKKKGLTWIHLSDWHQEGKKFDRKVVGDALVADIEKRKNISPDLGDIDFIVFSGDVANAGRPNEYEDAIRELFQPLLAASGVSPKRLFIVPGNHDLDRGLIPVGLSKPLKSHDQVETLWNEDEKRNQLFLPFQAFYRFLKDYTGHNQPKLADTCEFEIGGKKIALLGINSAWMCARNKEKGGRFNDQGCLCIGEQQIYEPLKQITNADIKIAILHHPFDWLVHHGLNKSPFMQ
jgi:predicted MPP superfamily phosphohydrolase